MSANPEMQDVIDKMNELDLRAGKISSADHALLKNVAESLIVFSIKCYTGKEYSLLVIKPFSEFVSSIPNKKVSDAIIKAILHQTLISDSSYNSSKYDGERYYSNYLLPLFSLLREEGFV